MTRLRIDARSRQILAAAASAFAEHGYHRTKVRDIADRAGLAEGTIYNYFGGKEELLLALLDAVNETDDRAEAFAAGEEKSVAEFIRGYVAHRLAAIEPHLDVLRPLLSELLVDPSLRERYRGSIVGPSLALAERYFGAKRSAGEIGDADVRLIARIVAAQVFGLAVLRMLGDEVLEQEWPVLEHLVPEVLLSGLSGPS